MNKFLVLSLILLGCRNDAITFAKLYDPHASCNALETTMVRTRGNRDTAVCRVGSELWLCTAGDGTPECKKLRDLPAERQP